MDLIILFISLTGVGTEGRKVVIESTTVCANVVGAVCEHVRERSAVVPV